MHRRTLLTASVAVIGSSVAGCLENSSNMGDSNDSAGSEEPTGTGTETDTTVPPGDDTPSGGEETRDGTETDETESGDAPRTDFAILDVSGYAEESASVRFDDEAVTVTGIIKGNNGCYTARLDEAVVRDERLVVGIESYEDAAETEACTMASIFIKYEVVIDTHDDRPAEAAVKHNGETVTTKQRS